MRLFYLILIFLFVKAGFSQSKTTCEKIYDTPDTLAQFGSSKKDLHNFFQDKIIPILGDCIKNKMEFVNSITLKFTIDTVGKVIAVDFLKPVLSEYCSTKLRLEILAMRNWKPGKVNAQHVCSVFIYPVACIKWQ